MLTASKQRNLSSILTCTKTDKVISSTDLEVMSRKPCRNGLLQHSKRQDSVGAASRAVTAFETNECSSVTFESVAFPGCLCLLSMSAHYNRHFTACSSSQHILTVQSLASHTARHASATKDTTPMNTLTSSNGRTSSITMFQSSIVQHSLLPRCTISYSTWSNTTMYTIASHTIKVLFNSHKAAEQSNDSSQYIKHHNRKTWWELRPVQQKRMNRKLRASPSKRCVV